MNREKQLAVYRHELKYFINKRDLIYLRSLLHAQMTIDEYGHQGDYTVRSLYFDTIDNKEYLEKIWGINQRKKIRLRVYSTEQDNAKLEIKHKWNGYTYKEGVIISKKDAIALAKGDSSSLVHYNSQTAQRVFTFFHQQLYRPTIMIEYEREAYIHPFQHIRITLDKDIRTAFSTELYGNINYFPVFCQDIQILEVKYNEMLPIFIRNGLANIETKRSEISKYCLGRQRLGI